MHGCSKCSATWTGMAIAHCSACCDHQPATFSTVNNFDKHRDGSVDRRKCLDPRVVGLELRTTGSTPTWAAPGDPDFNERFGRVGT